MREEDIKLICEQGDWSKADSIMNKLLYEKFGTVLEKKLIEFQDCKAQLKECISKNFGDSMVLFFTLNW